MNVLRSEFRKLFTTQTWFWLLLGSLVLNALQVILVVANTHNQADYRDAIPGIFGGGVFGYVFMLVLGAIGITAEFRHQTITPTVLTTPSRGVVIGAKLLMYLVLGAVYAVLGIVLSLAIALPWLSAKGLDVDLGSDGIVRAMVGTVIIFALYAVLGVGFGALVPNQAAAVTLPIIITVVIEPILSAIPYVRAAYPYFPSGSATALLVQNSDRFQDHYTLLVPVGGALVLLAWGVVLAMCGVYRMNKDIS
jgi:hypothetical protein